MCSIDLIIATKALKILTNVFKACYCIYPAEHERKYMSNVMSVCAVILAWLYCKNVT